MDGRYATAPTEFDIVKVIHTSLGEIITTPFGGDEEVMQSTRIIAGSEHSVSSGHDFSHLPWWRKDRFGWPIETIKGRPMLSVLRIVCQNIRKVTG